MISSRISEVLKFLTSTVFAGRPRLKNLAPDTPFYVIGDIHGRLDLLQLLLDRLAYDVPIICVGDYVDRGDQSAEVLRFLHKREDILCLKGNHEEMLLQFVEDPARYGARWLQYGGLQTLASFGVAPPSDLKDDKAVEACSGSLRAAMGKDLIEWLGGLPLWHQSGNVFVTHAGADPAQPVSDQMPHHLLWGHPAFKKTSRTDGVWVVHGHSIVNQVTIAKGRIAIDTGAYATGRLSAVEVAPGGVTTIDTSPMPTSTQSPSRS